MKTQLFNLKWRLLTLKTTVENMEWAIDQLLRAEGEHITSCPRFGYTSAHVIESSEIAPECKCG